MGISLNLHRNWLLVLVPMCTTLVSVALAQTSGNTQITWTKIADDVPWRYSNSPEAITQNEGRDSAAEFSYDGKLWIMGGYVPSRVNDVWSSTDGVSWTQVTNNASWSGRNLPGSVVFNNKMWILGGFAGPTATLQSMNDVWSSQNGADWAQSPNAPWAGRGAMSTCVYNNKIWVMGGFTYGAGGNTHYADVWSSADGTNWTQETSNAPWGQRAMHGTVAFQGKMWIIGGGVYGTEIDYNDVWSSTDGVNWTQEVANAPWEQRRFHSTVVYDEKIWVLAGFTAADGSTYMSNRNDVWCSEDGVNWTQAEPTDAIWAIRHEPTTIVHDDKIFLMGGFGQELYEDVWVYQVPEPATIVFIFLGGLGMMRRKNVCRV